MQRVSEAKRPRLLDQVRSVARVKHLSLRTEDAYVARIRQFILFHGKQHPAQLGVDEIRAFLSHLAVNDRVAASTQNVALCALLFLYRDVLHIELPRIEGVERARRKKNLPIVFTRAEVKRILTRLTGIDWLMASLLYGAGLQRHGVRTPGR